MKINLSILSVIVAFTFFSFTKEKHKNPEITTGELKSHISFLASDKLKGRKTGSEGDSLSANYIYEQLSKKGLKSLSNNGFQRFRVTDKIILGDSNQLSFNSVDSKVGVDFQPFAFSHNESFASEIVFAGYGFEINDDSLKWNDYSKIDVKGKVVLILRADPEVEKNVSNFIKYSRDRDKVLLAKDKGAIAVLLVSGKVFDPEDKFESLAKGEQSVGIPAFRIKRTIADEILKSAGKKIEDLEKILNETFAPQSFKLDEKISGKSEVIQTTVPTRNVIMLIPGNDKILKNEYVVLGAHFDHLGMGGVGSGSRVPDTVAVHYGADDNASGVSLIIELAEKLASSKKGFKRSIAVMAFSGEEMGLLGAKNYVENPLFDNSKVNAMFNFDMVGRLNENSMVQIGGVGTAEGLSNIVKNAADSTILKLSLSDEGYGPSDHAAFYGKNIPVLFISSGAHLDYHTPNDNEERINYEGMLKIADLSFKLISEFANSDSKLVFKEAGPKEVAGRGSRRKGVSLGIMPDFGGNVKNGLRADLVTPGRPAAIGGMKKGDVIISINGKPVGNIQDYMFRLNQLKHGETINVEVIRENKKEVLIIQL